MELFDDPTIKKLMAEDEKTLRDYKIDWLSNVLNSVDSYQVFLGSIDSLKRRLKNAIRWQSEDRKSLACSLREAENYIFVKFPEFLNRIGNPDIADLYEACRKIKDYKAALSEVEDSESNKVSFINYTPTKDLFMLQADNQEIQTAERKEKLTKALEEEENKLLELINLKDNPINDRIRSVVSLIKDWKREDNTLFSWEDVALSMLKNPWEIEFDNDVCPKCGNKRIKLYFSSPAWTWSLMCGRGGEMKICLSCKSQDFRLSSLN